MEGRCNAFSVELERKQKDTYSAFIEEIKVGEGERRIKLRQWEEEINAKIQDIKGGNTKKYDQFE